MSKAKINLCYIVNNFEVGGLEKVVIDLITNLDREKFIIFLICLDGTGMLFNEIQGLCENTLVLNKKSGKDIKLFIKIRSFIKKNRIDIIHAHNLAPLIYGGFSSRLLIKRPYIIYTEHNQVFRLSKWESFKFIKIYIRLADHIVTVSNNLKNFYRDSLGLKRNVETIYNGIDGKKFNIITSNSVRDEFSIPHNYFVVGTAVVLSKQKGLKYLIEAAKHVCSEIDDIRFIIGGDGPLFNQLKKQVADYNLDEKVIMAGYRHDIPNLLSSFDVYVLPSLWEGFPLALLEAMVLGKYIIASNVGGNPEIVENGINGDIVPSGDSKELADKIIKVYQNRSLLKECLTVNKERFRSEFSLENMLDKHSSLYQTIVHE